MVSTTKEQAANRPRSQDSHLELRKPQPFTADDYARRITRAEEHATTAGLTGLVIGPGPDLQYFCGYQPTAITERPTLLVISAGRKPSMLLPILERPDAEGVTGISDVRLRRFLPTARTLTPLQPGCSAPEATMPSRIPAGRCISSACRQSCRRRGSSP